MSGNINDEVKKWKIRHFLKTLREYRGTAPTGLITLPIPPGTQIPLVVSKLQHEYGTATNIKSHSTTLAVQAAIATTLQRLKLYRQTPENGLIIYAGNAYLNGKERKVCLDINPIRPVARKDYYCSNHFDVSHLEEMLEDSKVYGFIIMDGNGCLFGKVQGSKRTILGSKSVEMPKKHKKGGQSSQRFQRFRLEKRDAYIKMTCELATSYFIDRDTPNICALIIAGSSDFKNKLSTSYHFDARLRPLVWKIVDISYGGPSGFDQAIDAVKKDLSGLPLLEEKRKLAEFFDQVRSGERVCVGPTETLAALEAGVVSTLLIDEDSALMWNASSGSGGEPVLLTEYLADHYGEMGCSELVFITKNTGEGVQFIRGFNGVGAILKYDWQYFPPETSIEPEQSTETPAIDKQESSQNEAPVENESGKDGAPESEKAGFDLDLDDFFM